MKSLVQTIANEIKMTSLDVAEVTGKNHTSVMRDIRNGLKHGYLEESDFRKSEYINTQNKKQPCFSITEKGFAILLNRYKTTKKRTSPNVIYIVKHIGMDNYYKIGVTSNLDGRLKVLCNASPLGIKVVHATKTSEALVLEANIHNLLVDKNTNLEWFKLSDEDLSRVITFIEGGRAHGLVS